MPKQEIDGKYRVFNILRWIVIGCRNNKETIISIVFYVI